jgi:hypothetical protein
MHQNAIISRGMTYCHMLKSIFVCTLGSKCCRYDLARSGRCAVDFRIVFSTISGRRHIDEVTCKIRVRWSRRRAEESSHCGGEVVSLPEREPAKCLGFEIGTVPDAHARCFQAEPVH